jgi:hypothetical protein
LICTCSIFYYDAITVLFPFADEGVIGCLPLSRAVVFPEGVFFVAVVVLVVAAKVLDAELGSGLDDVAVVPVAGLADVGVVDVFAGAFVVSTFAFVAGVVVLTAGGFVIVVGGFVGVTTFFVSGFYGAFLVASGLVGFVLATGFLSTTGIFDSFLLILLCVNSTF